MSLRTANESHRLFGGYCIVCILSTKNYHKWMEFFQLTEHSPGHIFFLFLSQRQFLWLLVCYPAHNVPSVKKSSLKERMQAVKGNKFSPLRIEPFSKTTLTRVASPKSVFIIFMSNYYCLPWQCIQYSYVLLVNDLHSWRQDAFFFQPNYWGETCLMSICNIWFSLRNKQNIKIFSKVRSAPLLLQW